MPFPRTSVQSFAPSIFSRMGELNSGHSKISDLQQEKVWFGNCYIGQPRGREGIWGSAQRSRWKSWARISGDHRDERQGEPALAFSILGHPSTEDYSSLRRASHSNRVQKVVGPSRRRTPSGLQQSQPRRYDFIEKSEQLYCTFLSSARISSAVLTSGTELLTLRYTSRPLLSMINVARKAMSSPLCPFG
jgi:hypothetical protein